MVSAVKKFFVNYVNFKDRTTRRDYWLTVLAGFLFGFAMGFVLGITGQAETTLYYVCLAVVYLALFIPSLAMTVRRLHDINKSGWAIFIALFPIIGSLILFAYEVQPSVTENNNYGVQL